MAKKKFDGKAEALKILREWNDDMDKMPQVYAESSKVDRGTRVCVNLSDGDRKVFFYVERGMLEGWNSE